MALLDRGSVFFLIAVALAVIHFGKQEQYADRICFQIPVPDKVNAGSMGFAVSPDGRFLVFNATGADGSWRLWLRALNPLEARSIAGTESVAMSFPFWSPESRFAGFAADGKLKKIDVSGGPPKTICELSRRWIIETSNEFSEKNDCRGCNCLGSRPVHLLPTMVLL